MKRESGQATIEMLYVFPLGVLIFTFIVWSVASAWSLFWCEYQLQNAVICLSDSSAYTCKRYHESQIKKGASYLTISSLRLEKRRDQLYGNITFSYPFSGKQTFRLEKTIPWPLRQ